MGSNDSGSLRLKVSQAVAKIVGKGTPREVRLAAARGVLPLSGKDLLMVLFFFCNGKDDEIRQSALSTLRNLPATILTPVLETADLDPHLLELIARVRGADAELAGRVIVHPNVGNAALLHLARTAPAETLERLANQQGRLEKCPEIIDAILNNPHAESALKFQLGGLPAADAVTQTGAQAATEPDSVKEPGSDDTELATEDELEEEIDSEELSKYQMSLNLKVAEKIKYALTGDKEWRNLLIKDSNKLVQGAVLKNPRITDGEVIMVAKNKQSSDEVIRLILLNKDWVKLYEIKKALVWHPKTPLPKALRMISFLTQKDLKDLARSRNVQIAISTTARKELERKQKKA